MNHLSLFSGIGGIDLAAEWAGITTVACCEREPFPQKVLRKHWPNVPIYDDVCTLTKARLEDDGIDTRTIGIISAGYPCQPFSVAGNRDGKEDDRHLWPEVARLLREIRPNWFLGENVAGHITLGLDDVLTELESIGYTAQTFVIPSCAIGAPHRRDRVFIVGYTEHDGSYGAEVGRSFNQTSDYDKERENKTGEPERTGRPGSYEDVADTQGKHSRGLSIRTGTKYTGLECSGENVADTKGERSRETRELQCRRSEERFAGCGKNVADSTSIRQQGQRKSLQSFNSTQSGKGKTSEPINGCVGKEWSIESELGRILDGISTRLDKHQWPAGLGQEQHDWEPPRVATGAKDRVGRLKGLGNAVNPHQIYPVLAAIKSINYSLHPVLNI
ncbi:DNA cytosine methyltransferase [Paenibacillus macquariensis]|uniref:DNA (cytosine-5-)-methyltransferase n=1 Tax=Paenibacillus macquariensis TaxID=948756 RepID=A0ABY1JX83_9BACL|nr:DNA (cytosine-5-)-methyltransferase [Paenibacillus macquariensis]MEC0089363.1 DNA (cytosine-5-)-methyltransferase [Paenibacillus macquariensis]SIQ92986.1 DNA-methyltransferase (dcm) [Paenibacillus macquariensis]